MLDRIEHRLAQSLRAQPHWAAFAKRLSVHGPRLVRELSLLYAAYRGGSASALPPLPVQYADYAVWQRQWFSGEVLERQLRYWREALAGVPALELPSDRRRPPVSSYRGGWVAFAVPAALTGALKQLSRREGATLFMTLLAAFQVLLSRYSGQEDVAVGVPTAGRSRSARTASDSPTCRRKSSNRRTPFMASRTSSNDHFSPTSSSVRWTVQFSALVSSHLMGSS